MNATARRLGFATLALAAGVSALAAFTATGAEPAPQPREVFVPPTLPEADFKAILRDANTFILEPIVKARPWYGVPRHFQAERVRSNALLIALAAQNRMMAGGADAAKLATLRDAAMKLAEVVEKHQDDVPQFLKYAAILKSYPDIDVNPAARLAPVALAPRFTHDDIAPLFTNCGLRTHMIERQIILLNYLKTPFTTAQMEQIELLAYKVAIIGEVLREMDDFVSFAHPKGNRDHERPDWVRFATDMQQTGWRLGSTAHTGTATEAKQLLTSLSNSCIKCHGQFRE